MSYADAGIVQRGHVVVHLAFSPRPTTFEGLENSSRDSLGNWQSTGVHRVRGPDAGARDASGVGAC